MAPDANINLAENLTDVRLEPRLLLHRFEHFAAQRPDAIALEAENEQLSYAQLNARANQLARVLTSFGVSHADLVVLGLPASADCIAAMLAILKAGAAFVPVDCDWPPARIEAVVSNVQPSLVIYGQEEAAIFAKSSAKAVSIQELVRTVSQLGVSSQNTDVQLEPGDLCYVMHTSGTTGQPKGVMVSHQNLEGLFDRVIADNESDFAFDAHDRWLWLHSLAFGYSAWEIWGALSHGSCLVIVPRGMRKDPSAWCRLVERAGVTALSLTPSALRQMLELSPLPVEALRRSVRWVFLSGEKVRADDLQRWQRAFGNLGPRLVNIFALTETAGRIAIKDLTAIDGHTDSLIGSPVADAELFIVNPDDLMICNEGELLISGPMLSPGYLGEPEFTAQSFIDFDPGDGIRRRCYRSGDRVRYRNNGELEFLGRIDQQIKLRGYRIEPGDIESVLRQHPGVSNAAVVVHESAAGSGQLVAFLHADKSGATNLEFWPSLGEHLLYDELLYDFMAADQVRIASYQQAFAHAVQDKVVLDIGTGRHAVLARMCAQAGARKVYAVELLEEACDSARQLIDELGLSEQIEVICGDIQSIELSERIDVCTQGVVGNIGSSDGIAPLWNAARRWFADDLVAVPERCTTLFAPAELPGNVRAAPAYTMLAREYLQRLYTETGREFDPRLCVRNFPPEQLLAAEAVFEQLDFRAELTADYDGGCEFEVKRSGMFDGFLLWTRLLNRHVDPVDFLEHQQAWLPVWLPVAEHGVRVEAGDRIITQWSCRTADATVFPDYEIMAKLCRSDGTDKLFVFASPYQSRVLGHTDLHRALAVNSPRATEPNIESMAACARQHLPAHMVPDRWQFIEQLPLNSNGKLDRQRLVELVDVAPEFADTANEVKNNTGDVLTIDIASIWSEVLGHKVGLEEDFFDAGGDSILAVRLTTEVQRYLDDTVFLATLFDAPTVSEYSDWLRANHADAIERRFSSRASLPELKAADQTRPTPLSHAQQSLWFLQQLYPDSTAANEQFLIRINASVHPAGLATAWSRLMLRHSVLRTVFAESDGDPHQVVVADGVQLPEPLDWSNLGEAIARTKLHELAAAEITTRFDLTAGPLLRPLLLSLPGDETVILVTAHHIIADGLSVPILAEELAALYTNPDAAMAEPGLQFSDYAHWERSVITPDVIARESQWWREHLHGVSAVLLLPSAHDVSQRPRAVRHAFQISAALGRRLREIGRAERATPFMVLLTAWRIWLSGCLATDDLLVGTPMTLRKDAATAAMPGCMVNNVALRNALQPDRSFRHALCAERSALLEEWEHSLLPFDRVVEAIRPERVVGRHPLFQSMFFFSEQQAAVSGFSTDVLAVDSDSFWDMDLTIIDRGPDAAVDAVLSVRSDLVDEAQSRHWPPGFLRMLEAIVADPNIPLRALPLAGPVTEEISSWNVPELPNTAGSTLYDLFEHQASRAPDAVAVSDDNQQLTYAQLLDLAKLFGSALQANGVVPGDVVAVATARSAETVALLLGVSRSGAAWLALDPAFPAERLRSMLAAARPSLVVTDGAEHNLSACKQTDLSALRKANAAEFPAYRHSQAFVLFTSGSTGEPKGMMLPVAGIVNRCQWMWREYNFSISDRFAQRSSLNFVDSVWEIFGPLLHGAQLVVMPQKLAADPAGIVRWLREQQVTHLVTVPVLLEALLTEKLREVTSLHTIISSGEALLPELLSQFQVELADCRLLNTYGASEFWDATCARVDQLDAAQLQRVPIGRAIPNMCCHVLNEQGQSLPMGIAGELCISGINVASGYLANHERDTATFFPGPDGRLLYRTGDRASLLADGNIELLGRADRQFKINGIRVEATDIEANVLVCADVAVTALITQYEASDLRPTLFIMSHAGISLSPDDVRNFLRQRLPQALIPADIQILSEWPLTPSGKTDLQALGRQVNAEQESTVHVEPRNATEQAVADVWSDVLDIEAVSVLDDFFALGGHSLLATKVIARLEESCQVDLPLQSLFEQRTVAGVAESIIALRTLTEREFRVPPDDQPREVIKL